MKGRALFTVFALAVTSLFVLSGCVVVRDRGHGRSEGPPPHARTKVRPPCHPGKGPPPHAPAHGYRAKCPYRYYPRIQVYFSPKADIWFWIEDGEWVFGGRLPSRFRIRDRHHVRVTLPTPYPFQKHDRIRRKYGPEPDRGRKGPPGHRGREKDRGRGGPPSQHGKADPSPPEHGQTPGDMRAEQTNGPSAERGKSDGDNRDGNKDEKQNKGKKKKQENEKNDERKKQRENEREEEEEGARTKRRGPPSHAGS